MRKWGRGLSQGGRGAAGGRFGTFRKEEETLEGYGRPPYVVSTSTTLKIPYSSFSVGGGRPRAADAKNINSSRKEEDGDGQVCHTEYPLVTFEGRRCVREEK